MLVGVALIVVVVVADRFVRLVVLQHSAATTALPEKHSTESKIKVKRIKNKVSENKTKK